MPKRDFVPTGQEDLSPAENQEWLDAIVAAYHNSELAARIWDCTTDAHNDLWNAATPEQKRRAANVVSRAQIRAWREWKKS